jgi:hypothetical protein
MSIQFHCTSCHTLLSTSIDKPGSIVTCPRCRNETQVPQLSPPVALPARPLSKDPTIVIGTAIPTLILLVFFGYLLWTRKGADAQTTQPPERNAVFPVNSQPGPLASVAPRQEEPPAKAPPRDATSVVDENTVADMVEATKPNRAPPLDNPAMPPIANPVANGDQTFDLRGHAPQVGFKVREHTKVVGTRTNTFSRRRRRTVSAKTDLVYDTEKVYTVKDVLNDDVCGYDTKVITGDITFSFVDPTGKKRSSEQLDDFAGEVIRSTNIDGNWNHTLLENQPTDKQQAALTRLRSWFEDRESLPDGEQKLGASWEVDQRHIDKLLRSAMSAVSGKVRATFVRLERHEGDLCAVIEYKGRIRGRVEFGENQERIGSLVIDMTNIRSLKYGIDVKTSGEVIIHSADTVKLQGADVEVATVGRITIGSIVTVEK